MKKNNQQQSVIDSLNSLPEQIKDIIKQAKELKLPKYKNINQIVVSGMGGSNLAGRIVLAGLSDYLKVPIIINSDYEIPTFVNSQTLFIASSYSGNTEETIHAYQQAKKRKAKIVVLSSFNSNNKLAKLSQKDKNPSLIFTDQANPSGQPRLALGYALAGLISILLKAKLLKISQTNLLTASKNIKKQSAKLIPEKSNNPASKLADQLVNKNIIIATGSFLAGNAHALRNQFCENSKNFADYLVLPELNHYAMEGLSNPKNNNLIFLFFDSALYSPRVQKRIELTKKVIKKNDLNYVNHKLSGKNKLEQSLEMLQLGAWITFYLADHNKVDPLKIPWVDWFKKQLK